MGWRPLGQRPKGEGRKVGAARYKVQGIIWMDPQQARDAHTHRGGSSHTKGSARYTHYGGEHDTRDDSALTLAIFGPYVILAP